MSEMLKDNISSCMNNQLSNIADDCTNENLLKNNMDSALFFDKLPFQDCDDEAKRQLVQIKEKIYGIKTKISKYQNEIFVNVVLLPASVNEAEGILKDSESLKINLVQEEMCVILKEKNLTNVKDNLVFEKNSLFIDKNFLFKNEKCNCNRFSAFEFVEVKNKLKTEIKKVECCVKINYQHCLKICSLDVSNLAESSYSYIREKDVFQIELKDCIKYYEGVIVNPDSIITIKENGCEEFALNNIVELTLRNSFKTYECKIKWLGKVNDVKVAAVQLIPESKASELDNLLWDGKFMDKIYLQSPSYLTSLSSLRKISESRLIKLRVDDIFQLLKKDKMTDQIYEEFRFIYKNISFLINNLSDFLKISTSVLKSLKRKFLVKIPKLPLEITEEEPLLIKCSTTVLDIICDLCYVNIDTVDNIFKNHSVVEILEQMLDIYSECSNENYRLDELKKIFFNILFLFWHINKNGFQMTDKFSKMQKIFQQKNIDSNIKLAAALNISFLLKEKSTDISEVVQYLMAELEKLPLKTQSKRFCRTDIFAGIGKIFNVYGCKSRVADFFSTNNDETFQKAVSPEQKNYAEYLSSPITESSSKNEIRLTNTEYEKCIKIFIKNEVFENQIQIIKDLASMEDKELLLEFIKLQPEIDLEEFDDVLMIIRNYDEALKIILEKGTAKPSQFEYFIDLADKLLDEKNSKNVLLILNKIEYPADQNLDSKLLYLAYTALISREFEIFKEIIDKCKDKNSLMDSRDTFLTFIIKGNLEEDLILKAITDGGFDIRKKNEQNESPIVLAFKGFPNVYRYLSDNGADNMDVYHHYNTSDDKQ